MKKRSGAPLDDQPTIIDDEPEAEKSEEEVKPLVVPDNIPKLDANVGGTCAVSMEPLVLRPPHEKLPTACTETPFNPYNAPGQKRVVHRKGENVEDVNVTDIKVAKEFDVTDIREEKELDVKDISTDKGDLIECEGDANIQLATGLYNDWLLVSGEI